MARKGIPLQPRVTVQLCEDPLSRPFDEWLWSPQPGPQTEAYGRSEFEVMYGGAKGAGKSYLAIGWFMKGNATGERPVDLTYLNHPGYVGLAVRKEYTDVLSWGDEAWNVYRPMGAIRKSDPDHFLFPSGAKIFLGHLSDERDAEKLFGRVIHRLFIDQVEFIKDKRVYMKAFSCVRSAIDGIQGQILLTANPGGPGTAWVLDRFIEPVDKNGRIIPPMTPVREEHWNPFLKRSVATTRIFVPGKLADNPKLVEKDPLYYNRLASLDEAERRAYLEGDWHALGGAYFKDYRRERRADEPPYAQHVIRRGSRVILKWWPRWGGCDWGFGHHAVTYKATRDPKTDQTLMIGEYIARELESERLGEGIARFFLPDLEGLIEMGATAQIPVYLSTEAFGMKRDSIKTYAEEIQRGIEKVLGAGTAHLHQADPDAYGILLKRAHNERIAGAQTLAGMLRWRQIQKPSAPFDPALLARLRYENAERAKEYEKWYQDEPEILPKLLIVEEDCPVLVSAIPKLVREEGTEDVLKTTDLSDDAYDAWRYTIHSRDVAPNRKPRAEFVHERLETMIAADPTIAADINRQIFIQNKAIADYGAQEPAVSGVRLGRSGENRGHWLT